MINCLQYSESAHCLDASHKAFEQLTPTYDSGDGGVSVGFVSSSVRLTVPENAMTVILDIGIISP